MQFKNLQIAISHYLSYSFQRFIKYIFDPIIRDVLYVFSVKI